MATITTRTDDLNGDVLNEDDTATALHLDSPHGDVAFELDMGKASYDKLVKALAPFLKVSRPVTLTPSTPARKRDSESDAPAIRAWAAENGHTVSARGAIPAKVREAYDARDRTVLADEDGTEIEGNDSNPNF